MDEQDILVQLLFFRLSTDTFWVILTNYEKTRFL